MKQDILNGNNSAKVVETSLKYSQEENITGGATEAGTSNNSYVSARNWLDGIYEKANAMSIKYPVFMGTTYSMNYININDAFLLAKELNKDGNPYGLNENTADSHLMKNSEWGACAYLGQSQYGLNGKEILVNNVNFNSGNKKREEIKGQSELDSVYTMTGLTTSKIVNQINKEQTLITNGFDTIKKINEIYGNTPTDMTDDGIYTWKQLSGQGASISGTIYGVYDMGGGIFEETAAYVANGHENLSKNGKSLAYERDRLKTESTEYTMVYPHDAELDNEDTVSHGVATSANYAKSKVFGDAIREVSISGESSMMGGGTSSWYKNSSYFMGNFVPFSGYGR